MTTISESRKLQKDKRAAKKLAAKFNKTPQVTPQEIIIESPVVKKPAAKKKK